MRILQSHQEPAGYHEWNPQAVEVANALIAFIEAEMPGVFVEHVGSTSIAGCAGKGVVDLMLVYPSGALAASRTSLDRLGFQHQMAGDPFPEDRPMRVGAVQYDGREFRIQVHVIAEKSAEVAQFRAFRDALRADPELVRAYMARKREIVAAGITEPRDYTDAKSSFCRDVLAWAQRETRAQ